LTVVCAAVQIVGVESDSLQRDGRRLVAEHDPAETFGLIESQRRGAENGEAEKGLLEVVAPGLPALIQAKEYQQRAARVGFRGPDGAEAYAAAREALEAFQAAADDAPRGAQLGDLLFAVVRLANAHRVDAETALREANARFKRRFEVFEEARKKGV